MFTPAVHSITPPAISAARQLMQAGQARAQRLLDKIEAQCSGSAILELGATRAMVRNLCAELAAFDPEDGSIEVEFKGLTLHVLVAGWNATLIQHAGIDIGPLLSQADEQAITHLALDKKREAA